MSRRRFVEQAGAGTAALALPAFLGACGAAPPRAAAPSAAAGDPFAALFGVDRALMRRVLGELGARGADQAELYFQSSRSTSILYQDGIVSRADASVDLGVGLRCVIGEQTGYAYTEELTPEAMLAAARTASSIAARASGAVPPRSCGTTRSRTSATRSRCPGARWASIGSCPSSSAAPRS
ncbi:MAG: hypothetical protein M5U28_39730 [Sandaracinaceae bacterium]|nr:hypothetical protein [Sandaracinaceae bacterium]